MKKLVLVLLVFGLSVYVLFSLVQWQNAEKAERSAQALRALGDTSARIRQQNEAQLLEAQTRLVSLRRGEAAAATYHLCHTHPPTTKEHQAECRRLDAQLAQDEANDAKHPW